MTANRIVVGVDGSSGSADALEWCATIARGLGAEVVVVHAVTLADYPELIRAPARDAAWRRELEATVRD
ncbi:MAG: universal stress protein, partial [Actinomycetota bacterium]